MARTIAEIKKEMTDKFMSDSTLRNAYGISGDATWENTFSAVSIENILIYIVAVSFYTLELMFESFCADVDERIARNTVPTVRWYHTQAMAFQYGYSLIYDKQSQAFKYTITDTSKQIIKYCAVKDRGSSIQILVSGTSSDGLPSILSNDVLTAFKSYMNSVKIAGVILDIRSLPADNIRIAATVQVDPQVINADGKRISDGIYPVYEAIDNYLRNIMYGGTFNKTKCVDAIQDVDGVLDVVFGTVEAKAASATEYTILQSNNYTAVAGCFISNNLESTLSYVV